MEYVSAGLPGELTPRLLREPQWTDAMVDEAGIEVRDVPFVSVGGGIGSFVTVNYLRIAGVPADRIAVLSTIDHPWQTYEYLTRVSQIPRLERIRSDSSSRPDNIWGFPSYALAEAWRERTARPLLHVLGEPVFTDYWTPRAGTVFAGLARESARIGYPDMLVKGVVRMVRRRAGGGYFVILTPPAGSTATKRVAYRARFVHLAVGYPGLKFLPDLQAFRETYGDFHHVVNAYEPHEHVYEYLKTTPGTVMVRGGGIVASRVLQRLMDDRARYGLQTEIEHVFRTYVSGAHGPHIGSRRKGGHGFAYQGFNYPKSVWGGQLKARMRRLEGEQRAAEYRRMGGTNTPKRRKWQQQMRTGREAGWYRAFQGTVEEVHPGPETRLTSIVKCGDDTRKIVSDFIVDCTGLEADIADHRVLDDLLTHGGAGRNPLGRLDVERTFEVIGTASGDGAVYASGTATLGGYFPGVDTFLGLQVAAQEITDDLARRGWCDRLGLLRSTSQWIRWALGRPVEGSAAWSRS
ncbi:hypothetical protein [Jidongwangia harbinensis]|uniref:hypothetical protein n=1 Tax=Jidongwangia harbinensis TaxID=2878561 RepID=UPI001CD940A3|nr:hypothetical protein [Jidongwangia harbinensis]MCA2216431.1 hypothetical protein [Jidongwangia harbinensis]